MKFQLTGSRAGELGLRRLRPRADRHVDLGARFARLAYSGHLSIGDPDVTARQFLALVNAELQITFMLGGTPSEEEVLRSATNGVRTFLRAFERQATLPAEKSALAHA